MKYCFVDYRISAEEYTNLALKDIEIIKIPKTPLVYDAINGHPDIQMAILENKTLLLQKNIDEIFKKLLKAKNINFCLSEKELGYSYPYNINLNGVILKDFFIHNLKFTDPMLLSQVSKKQLINVKQGYTKCSCAIVSDKAIITSDENISKTLLPFGIDVLLLPPGDIKLEGFQYGFIGGSCGLIATNEMAFFGDLKNYKYGSEVLKFLKKYDVKPIYLSKGKLTDRGSIFSI